jgi:dihydroxy-acid dehydratase
MVGHVAPEAAVGGPIAAVREGDTITIDIDKRQISLDIPVAELHERLSKFERPAPKYTSGVMAKYVALVGSASDGAVTSRPTL